MNKSLFHSPVIAFPIRDYLHPVKGREYEFTQTMDDICEELLGGTILLTNVRDFSVIRGLAPQGFKIEHKMKCLLHKMFIAQVYHLQV